MTQGKSKNQNLKQIEGAGAFPLPCVQVPALLYREENMDWKMAFEKTGNKEVDERVKKAIMRVYNSYPAKCLPQGICDPMHIMNVIAMELGIGDGMGSFNLPPIS